MPGKVPAPRIDRSFSLKFMGDSGLANFHKAFGWLCKELGDLSGPYTEIAILNGTGWMKNIQAVGRGQVDVALVTPAAFVRMAREGLGPCAREPFPHLRALGYVPQDDRLIFAVRRECGIRSFEDLRTKKPALRIAVGYDGVDDFMGLGAQQLMRASGIMRSEFESWGGAYIECSLFQALEDVIAGRADAIIQEAIMTPWWSDLCDQVDLNFIPIEPAARDTLMAELGWPSGKVRKGYLRGLKEEMEFLDFSHFLLVTTEYLPDDIAYAMAWSLIERWNAFEMQYRHLDPERSPVTYPIDPRAACRVSIPLHPAAERYFREAGHL
jgi:TRAP-type uncharacterized transport system substrate-binding protein